VSYSQAIPEDSLYLGQTPPGNTPKVFELPVSSGLRAVERITITSDGKEIYYSELNTYPPTEQRIKCFKYLENKWQGPFNVFEGYMAPGLSINNNIMYIQKNLNTVPCTYFSIRNDTGWSAPARLFSTSQQTHYFQETNLKNYYVASILPSSPGNSDLCKLVIHNSDTTIQSIGTPVSTSAKEDDFFIAKDESYIIVCQTNIGSASDLYISYKSDNGNWTNPKILGNSISTPNPNWEYGPYVTNDNKYLFFTRGAAEMSSYFIYWVRIDNLIDSLKHTNFVPYVKNSIPHQTAIKDSSFNYQIPDSIFIDDDGNNTLTYSATKSNGYPLPSWLSFNPATRTFSGTQLEATAIPLSIKVIATDTAKASASYVFNLTITDPTGIKENNNQHPKESQLLQNYPNPFNPTTVISYQLSAFSNVKLTIYNVLGKKIKTLAHSFQNAGAHSVVWDATNERNSPVSSGMYFYRLETENINMQKKMLLIK
jgi:hypothetical protein